MGGVLGRGWRYEGHVDAKVRRLGGVAVAAAAVVKESTFVMVVRRVP